jgi:hypothetical protein
VIPSDAKSVKGPAAVTNQDSLQTLPLATGHANGDIYTPHSLICRMTVVVLLLVPVTYPFHHTRTTKRSGTPYPVQPCGTEIPEPGGVPASMRR